MCEQPEKLWTVKELAEYLQLSTRWVQLRIRDGEFTYIRVGRRPFIPQSSVTKFIKRHTWNASKEGV